MELEKIDKIVNRYSAKEEYLIQILLEIEREFNWLPKEALVRVSEKIGIPMSRTYKIASFYKAMHLKPIGKHLIQVCLGTACHVRGGAKIFDEVRRILKIKADETTPDMKFTLRRVNCLGCCAMGPVMVVGDEYHGRLKVADVEKILSAKR